MARSKSIPDAAVFDRLLKTLSETGPDNLTFQRASADVGLSAATLVQRFGSREKMIEKTLLAAWDRLDAETRAADAGLPVDAGGAVSLLLRLTPEDRDGHGFADGLLLLREDFRNPALRARGAAWGEFLAMALGRRLTPHESEAERLGWQMAELWQGAILWWGFTRDGRPRESIGKKLEEWCAAIGENSPRGPGR